MTREEAIRHLEEWREIISSGKRKQVIDMAIEALQGDMYCPNCGVRLVPENEYVEPTQTHSRLIDADALLDKLPKEYFGSTIHLLINDAPTVQADRPHGEWVFRTDIPIGGGRESAGFVCTNCGKDYFQKEGLHFCPNCGAKMTKGGGDE